MNPTCNNLLSRMQHLSIQKPKQTYDSQHVGVTSELTNRRDYMWGRGYLQYLETLKAIFLTGRNDR